MMTKVAIPHWQGRVSPVFDVAARVLVVDFDSGIEKSRSEVAFNAEQPHLRVARLARTEANVLVCGAISRPLEMAIIAAGIEVIPQTCGDIEEVLAAFADGRLNQDVFLMPGCCRRRRHLRMQCRRRGRHGTDAEKERR